MPEVFATRTLRELSRTVFSHLIGMCLIVGVLTGGTYWACETADPIYESSVTILVKQPKRATDTIQEVSPDRSLEVFLKTQRELVLSDRVLARTMALLEGVALQRNWREARDALARADVKDRDDAQTRLGEVITRIDKSAETIIANRQRDLHEFRKCVDVETPGGQVVAMSEIFTISVQQKDGSGFAPGEQAKMAADLLAGCYVNRHWEVQAEGFRGTSDFVQIRLDELREKTLGPAQKAHGTFMADKLGGGAAPTASRPTTQADNVLNPADVVILEQLLKSGTEAGAQIVRTRFEEEKIRLGSELARAKSLERQIAEQLNDPALGDLLNRDRVDGLEARAVTLYRPLVDSKENAKRQEELSLIAAEFGEMTDDPRTRIVVPQEVLKNNDIINKMKKKVADLIIERNKMKGQFAGTYRQLIELYIEIARAKLEVIEELQAERKALDVLIGTTEAQLEQVAAQITRVTEKLDAIARLLPEYDRLQQELKTARTNYASIETELLQAQADEQRVRKEVTIQVVDQASTPDPDRPVIPWTPVYTGVAGAVSLLIALAYAFLADHFDHSLRSIHEVERYLGTPVLGTVRRSGRRLVV